MMRVIVWLFICGTALAVSHTNRIVGGVDVDIEKYPFMASMHFDWYESAWRVACGGSLITVKTILSAAHCYVDRNAPPNWRVRIGSSYAYTGGQVHTIDSFVLHVDYNNLDNDVAIVKLASPITLSANVGTARIAGHHYHLEDDTPVTTMGWGRLVFGGGNPEKLQEVEIYTVNQQICWQRYEHLRTLEGYTHYPEVSDRMMCAGILDVGGKDSCTGDSGGPMVHDGDVIVGITSWGYECADSFYPGVKVRVSSFVNWIIANGSW